MAMSKDLLIFDTANPDATDNSDNVGAYLRAGDDGTQLSATGTSLDVNVSNAGDINVQIDAEKTHDAAAGAGGDIGMYILGVRQDTLAADTSADGDYARFKFTAAGRLYTDTVISSASVQGLTADDAADADNPVKTGTRSVSGALTAISANNDRADMLSDDYRRVYVNSGPNVGGANATTTVDTTAGGVALPASALAGRRTITIQNLSTSHSIYLGFGTVTAANGLEVPKKSTFGPIEMGDDLALKAIAAAGGSVDARTFELA